MKTPIKIAKKIARTAGDILLTHFGQSHEINAKESIHSIVTPVDLLVEKYIIDTLLDNFPLDSILSEESGFIDKNSDQIWVIDPLDGSSYYSRSIETFSVSIALYKNERPVLGVVFCPIKNELFHAIANEGAYLNDEPIQCSHTAHLQDAIGSFGHRYIRLEKYDNTAKKLLQSIRSVRAGGSCAMELCYLACGRIDLALTVNQSFWDYAAGMLIAKESGGNFTTLSHENWDFQTYWLKKFDLLAYSKKLALNNV